MASGRYRSPDSRARSIRSPLLTFLLTLGLSLSGAWDLSWSQVQGRSDQDIAAEIDTLDARLAALRMRYTDAHPDVIELKRNRDALVRLLGEPPRGQLSPTPGPVPSTRSNSIARIIEKQPQPTHDFYPGGTLRLPLTVYETAGAGIKDFPITAVVPLPSGRYQTTLRFRLLGPSGQAVPAQFDVLERWWARDQSIRHLKIQFRADVTPYDDRHPNSGSAVYQLTDDGRSASAESPLQVRDESDHIEVITGPLRFAVSKREFGLFDRVSLDRNGDGRFEHGERILETGGETGFELLGRNIGEVQLDATRDDVQVAIEESGPERVVIRAAAPTRVEGPRGHEHGFAVRIFAYAGLPFVKVDYQLQNSDKKVPRAGPLYFDSLTLNLGIDGLDHRITRFGAEGGRVFSSKRTGRLMLAQKQHDRFSITAKGESEPLARGNRAGGFLDVRNGTKGVAAFVRFFWETWPNGLVATDRNDLQVQLFPTFSAQWHKRKLSPTGLYWLADMQHVYKEILFLFHDGSVKDTALRSLAETFDEPPVALLPPQWYALTSVTLDMGGVIPTGDIGDDAGRRFHYPKDAYRNDPSKYRFGWDSFYLVDPGRKYRPAIAGGWAHAFGGYTLDPSPARIRQLELLGIGELNTRPHWLHGYNHASDADRLQLGAFLPWQASSWRKGGKVIGYDIKGTGLVARPRDDAHGWYYHVRESYYATANPWIRDWYEFVGEYRKTHFANRWRHSSRGLGHALANAVDAYRVTGDTKIIRAAHSHINGQLRDEQNRRYGFRNSLCCGKFGEAVFQAGYLARALINLMEEVEPTSQVYTDAFQRLSGMMAWNLNVANFSNYLDPRKGETGKSHGSSLTFVDPQAWYYWHTGKKKYWMHAREYVNHGLAGGQRPFGRSQFRRWTGAFHGRWYRYVTQNPRIDSTPPEPIRDLKASVDSEGIRLAFARPEGAVRYHLVWGDKPISEDFTTDASKLNWWAAHALASPAATDHRPESIQLPAKARYAALFAFDAADNMNRMSNLVEIPKRHSPAISGQ